MSGPCIVTTACGITLTKRDTAFESAESRSLANTANKTTSLMTFISSRSEFPLSDGLGTGTSPRRTAGLPGLLRAISPQVQTAAALVLDVRLFKFEPSSTFGTDQIYSSRQRRQRGQEIGNYKYEKDFRGEIGTVRLATVL